MTSPFNMDTVGAIGVNRDIEDYRLSPYEWSDLLNMRCVDGNMVSIGGRKLIFAALGGVPRFVLPFSTQNNDYWTWASLTKLFVEDGVAESDITGAAGPYTATSAADWNGTVLQGLVIFNNGVNLPQLWNGNPASVAVNLTNWPATMTAKVVRALGPFLVAINLNLSGTNYPHRVRWSHPADPGSVPVSWDPADPSKDTGEAELPDVNSGVLVDAMPLGGALYLYKKNSTWRMRYSGGQSIFDIKPYLDTSGILAPRCVGITPDGLRHFVATQDDIIVHDGQSQPQSVLDKRMRRTLASALDPATFGQSFVYTNRVFNEMYFCYPTNGSAVPNMAIGWNSKDNSLFEKEVDFIHAASGPIPGATGETWDAAVGIWDTDPDPWSKVSRLQTVVANVTLSRLLQLDTGNTFNGAPVQVRAQRLGLGMIGRKKDGSVIVDFQKRKLVTRVYPRMVGGPVNVRLAAQDLVKGVTRWTDSKVFNPATMRFVDLIVEGAAIGIEFSSQADVAWRLEGYELDLSISGGY